MATPAASSTYPSQLVQSSDTIKTETTQTLLQSKVAMTVIITLMFTILLFTGVVFHNS